MSDRIFVPNAPIVLAHPSELQFGDRIRMGKRIWKYQGRCEQVHPSWLGQNEYIFTSEREQGDEPGDIGPVERVFAQSEIEALAAVGFVERQTWSTVNFNTNKVTTRSETNE